MRPGRTPRRRPRAGSVATSGQSARSVTRSLPNRLLPLPRQGADARADRSARRNPRRLRCLARSFWSAAALLASTSRLATFGRSTPSAARTASASDADELDRVVAGARPGQDRLDLLERGGRAGRPELGDRDDRDVASASAGRGRRGRRWARPRPGAAARPLRAGRREGRRRIRRGARTGDGTGRRGRARGTEPELAAGHRDGDRDGQQAEDDEGGRRVTSAIVPAVAPEASPPGDPGKGTPRPGGRTGRRKKR